MPRNILIFHAGALGDFIFTWPLALAVSRLHPQSRVFYITHSQKGLLAQRLLGVESRDIEDGWHHLFSDPGNLPDPAAKLLADSHLILNFLAGENSPWTTHAHLLAPRAQLLTIHPRPETQYDAHISVFLLNQLKSHPALYSAMAQMLQSLSKRGLSFPRHPDGTILIHPGSGSLSKNWPLANFIGLISRLKPQHPVKVLLGEAELERLPSADIHEVENVAEIRRPTTYLDLLNELIPASVYLGHDTGPSHLAALLGIPTLALFGPTNPALWHPLGPRVMLMQFPSASIENVHQAIDSLYALGSGIQK